MTLVVGLSLGIAAPTFIAPGQAAAQGVDLEAATVQFSQLAQRLETLRNRRRTLEVQYAKTTDAIAARKRARRGQNLLSDLELQNLLKRGRATADELYQLQSSIRQVEAELRSARRDVLAAFDEKLTRLESSLVSGTGANRPAVIAEMNRLRQARHAYVAPTVATPDLDLEDLPGLDAAQEDPEEARAAAAELDDANRKLKDRIGDLDARIADLEGQKRLRRKARNFRDQENFFDEAQKGSRKVAVRPAGSRTGAGTDSDGVGGGDTLGATNDNGAEGEPELGAGAPQDRGEGDFDQADPGESPAPDSSDDETANGNGGFTEDGGAARDGVVGSVDVLPGTGAPIDPFAGDNVVIAGEVEAVNGASGNDGEASLDGRLRNAKRERERLEKKSRQLEKRSTELKRLADEF